MNEAVRFTREVIAIAKERGLSCMVMADGAYAFTGDLPQIMGEKNGMFNEKGWVATENARNYTFLDLFDYLMSNEKTDPEVIISCSERTVKEIELDTEFYISTDRDTQEIKVYQNKGGDDNSEYDQILLIRFPKNSINVCFNQTMPSGDIDGLYDTAVIKKESKICKTILPDMPTYISAVLMEFLMHVIFSWKHDSENEKKS